MSKTPAEKSTPEILWLADVDAHDYPAAASYLQLIYPPEQADALVKKLQRASIQEFKSKDLFRASQLSLLGVSNSHVNRDLEKISAGHALSPLLLVRDAVHGKVVIADGYHRLCAIYSCDEDAWIHCKIV